MKNILFKFEENLKCDYSDCYISNRKIARKQDFKDKNNTMKINFFSVNKKENSEKLFLTGSNFFRQSKEINLKPGETSEFKDLIRIITMNKKKIEKESKEIEVMLGMTRSARENVQKNKKWVKLPYLR